MNKIDEVYRRFSMIYPRSSRFVTESKIHADPFCSLVGVVLSAQTRDEMTGRACNNLFGITDTPEYITNWISDIGDEEAGSSAAFGAQRAGFDSRVSDQN